MGCMSMSFFWFRKSKKSDPQAARKGSTPPPAAGPRRARLELESLEERSLLTASVISGYVFDDLNYNGIYEPQNSEKPIANTQIALQNSAGVIVGQTTTDA